jgi:hypothetical protein
MLELEREENTVWHTLLELRRAHQNDKLSVMKEQQQDQNPLELINNLDVSSEEKNWAKKWWSRGRLRWGAIKDEASLRFTKFRHFVSTHEIGHKRLVHSTGHEFLEINTKGGGGAEGWVGYKIKPKETDKETLYDMAIIKLGGLVVTGSYYGTGSDIAGVNNVARIANEILGESRSSFISIARARAEMGVGSRDSAESEAFDYTEQPT